MLGPTCHACGRGGVGPDRWAGRMPSRSLQRSGVRGGEEDPVLISLSSTLDLHGGIGKVRRNGMPVRRAGQPGDHGQRLGQLVDRVPDR